MSKIKFRSMEAVYKPGKMGTPLTLLEGEFCYNKDFTSMYCWPPTDGEPVDNGLRTLDIIGKWIWNKNVESPTLEGSISCGRTTNTGTGILKLVIGRLVNKIN